jgi:arginase
MIKTFGYASGIAGVTSTACAGPLAVYKEWNNIFKNIQSPLDWEPLLYPKNSKLKSSVIHDICQQLAFKISNLNKNEKFLVVGGDHSSAIGTWSGLRALLDKQDPSDVEFGLLWFDAHMDAHTIETSPSGNIHGMPISVLLNKEEDILSNIIPIYPKIRSENLCLIGIRDYEREERIYLESKGVKIFYMSEIREIGLKKVIEHALAHVTKNTKRIGLSIDLDVFNPKDIMGVCTPAKGGLNPVDFLESLKVINNKNIVGLEIAEFNPALDENNKTLKLVYDIINQLLVQ